MKKLLNITAMLLCIVMTFSIFASCALYDDKEAKGSESASASGNAENSEADKFSDKELKTPVITIGKRSVTLAEFLEVFEQVKSYYSKNYGYSIDSDNETLSQYIDLISESLVEETMELYQADELGLSKFTDEQKKEIEKRYEKEINDMYKYYQEYASEELGESATAEDLDKKVDNYIIEEAQYYCGKDTTVDEYKEYLKKQAEEDYLRELLKEEKIKDVKVSKEDVESWYNDSVKDDTEYYAEHPETYKDEMDSFETTGFISDGETAIAPLYVPENYYRVYDIFVTNDKKLSEDYTKNEEKMTSLKTEYGELAFENALAGATTARNSERMNEILEEYNDLEKENLKELKKLYKESKTKIDEAYKKLEAGEDFKTVMKEYTQDKNYQKDGAYEKKGRLISTFYESKTDWSEIVKEKFKTLSEGEYTKVFLDNDGYHIIYLKAKEQSGAVKLDDVKDAISKQLLTKKQDEYYEELKKEWVKDTKKIEKNIELLDKVGK